MTVLIVVLITNIKLFVKSGLEISVGHRTMTDRNKCLTKLKLFQSDIMSERKIKTEIKYLYNVSIQA